jgi:hypothetical protein
MALSIFMINFRRRVIFVLIVLTFIAILMFDQQYTETFSYTSVSYDITERNNIPYDEHLARLHQPLSSSILRGILIFYPHNQEVTFLPELLWFFRSWIEMMKDEPSLWRTDLIIYTGDYTTNLQQLGCVYNRIRIDRQEPPQCRVFPYKRIHLRDVENTNNNENYLYQQVDKKRSILLATHLGTYEYLDSINIIAECYPSFSMYDYILRTDMDVFLTKNFGHFVPNNNTILVGRGGYSTTFNTVRLGRIAKDMGWLYANIINIGSTW